MFPVAMACSVVASMSETRMPSRCERMVSTAATASVITSGSGPSSRMDPASTKGTSRWMHSYITPLVRRPRSTPLRMEPQRRTSLMVRRWLEWPPSVVRPSRRWTPSEVPMVFDSMSCVANPLPAKRTSTNPSRTRAARSGPAPVWIRAGPHTASSLPPAALARRIRSDTSATRRPFGFSEETSEVMNSNGLRPWGRASGVTRTPSSPTTTWSPMTTRCIGADRTRVWSADTTSPQSISGFSTSSHLPRTLTEVGRLVVE